jgi:nucleoside-diphosphate-sugar epimerase
MEASLKVGIEKVVHVSSIVTWGRSPEAPFNENSPVGEHTSEYARTKYEGDQVAWELHKNKNLPLVMIYPCAVLGADDPKSTGNHIRLLINKKMPIRGLESSAITFVHENDVAESIVRALEKNDNIGEGYIIGKVWTALSADNLTSAAIQEKWSALPEIGAHPCNHLQKLRLPWQAMPSSIGRGLLTPDI